MTDDYTEAYLDPELQAEYFEEAGGLISWLKRSFSGVDSSLERQIKEEMHAIRSKEDRDALLRDLDDLISEARDSLNDGTAGDILRSVGFGSVSSLAGSGAGTIHGRFKLAAASKQAARVAATPVSKLAKFFGLATAQQAANNAAGASIMARAATGVLGTIATYAMAAGAGASLISLVLRTVNRYGGGMEEYLEVLVKLRAEVGLIRV